MRTIEIDDEVYACLQGKALAFVETAPNETLRRLLGLSKTALGASDEPKPLEPEAPREIRTPRRTRRQRNANLSELVSNGFLSEGQFLFLIDYRGNRLSKYRAPIRGSYLEWEGHHRSMSDLARELLQGEGYDNNSFRGPNHWCTVDGVTVKRLWDQHLEADTRSI